MQYGGLANVAINITRLGVEAKFIGKVGNDVFGQSFKENLRKNRVEDLTFVDQDGATGLCTSLTDRDGERTMIANRGSNDNLSREEISTCLEEIGACQALYFSGYSLLSDQTSSAILYAAEQAHRMGCQVFFNPGAPNIASQVCPELPEGLTDVLILNQDEAKALTHKINIDESLVSLSGLARVVVITLGKDGCVAGDGKMRQRVATHRLETRDTTGAGDAFAAGFIVGRLRNEDLAECAHLGNHTARRFLEQKGGRG